MAGSDNLSLTALFDLTKTGRFYKADGVPAKGTRTPSNAGRENRGGQEKCNGTRRFLCHNKNLSVEFFYSRPGRDHKKSLFRVHLQALRYLAIR